MGDGEAGEAAAGAGHSVTKTKRWLNPLAFLPLGPEVSGPVRRVMADHAGQEVGAYLLKPRDFYLPYVEVRDAKSAPGTPSSLLLECRDA